MFEEGYYNPEDGCTYCYDETNTKWVKICDIKSYADLPDDIKQQIKAAKKKAEEILSLPTE